MKLAGLILVVLAAGCSKSAPKSTAPSSRAVAPRTGPPSAHARETEVARGDLREALLHLQRVHFGLDTAELLPPARASLEAAADRVAAHADVELYVDGHTDERGTTEYNLALGDRRATAVIDFLVRLGIERGRLHAMTFGAERPLEAGRAVGELASNRRAEFRLMRGQVQLVLEAGTRFRDDGTPIASKAGSPSRHDATEKP